MNKLLLVGMTSLVLFGISGAASYLLQQQKQAAHPSEAPAVKALPALSGREQAGPRSGGRESDEPLRAAVRPPYNPGTEEVARLTGELRSRLAAARAGEKQAEARRKQLELIQNDLRDERAAIDDLRKQVKKELEAVNAVLANLEQQRQSLKTDRGKTAQATKDLQARTLLLEKDEQENLKKMSLMYNTMPPESAARIMRSLADTGKMDTAVKVLGLMQERHAAKVLAELRDPTLAVQLLEKLKGLRRPVQRSDAAIENR